MGAARPEYKIVSGKPEGKRLSGRFRHVWGSNIKIDVGEIVYKGINWIQVDQDRFQ
jgi:hypothetical protein